MQIEIEAHLDEILEVSLISTGREDKEPAKKDRFPPYFLKEFVYNGNSH